MNQKHAHPAGHRPDEGKQGISNRPDDEEPRETAADEDEFEDAEDDEEEDEDTEGDSDENAGA